MKNFSRSNLLGTAHWARLDYIARKYDYRAGRFFLGRSLADYRDMIGLDVKSHVFLCGETQSGKGRAFIITNLIDWRGSVVAVSSKPDLIEVAAKRRGGGDAHCKGLGQKVLVADPKKKARIEDVYRCYYNPLDDIDQENPIQGAFRVVEGYTIIPPDGESSEWTRRGIEFSAFVIAHIKTSPKYENSDRNLVTLFELVLAGKDEAHEKLKQALREGDERIKKMGLPSGFTLLLKEMALNPACDGLISKYAKSLMKSDSGHEEGIESIRLNSLRALRWLLDKDMRQFVTGKGMSLEQKLEPGSLKADPQGVSLFIHSMSGDKELFAGWEKLMFSTCIDAHKDIDGPTALGHKTLYVIDEFLQYGRLEKIQTGITEIASSGCALFLAVQKLGPLKDSYKQSWETFISGADFSIWFDLNETEGTLKYATTICGEQHVELLSKQFTQSQQTGQSKGRTNQSSRGGSLGGGRSTSESETKQWNKSKSKGSGKNTGYGSSTNARGGSLIDWLPGHSSSQHAGRNTNLQSTTGSGRTQGTTDTDSESWNSTWQESESTQVTHSYMESISAGVSQQHNKRPLLSIDQARVYLANVDDQIQHPLFPGLALVIKRNEPPFVVRKAYYDMDPYFERKFTPHPDHQFIPISRQPMLEHMYTPEHHIDFGLPDKLVKAGCQLRPWSQSEPGSVIRKGEPFAELVVPKEANDILDPQNRISVHKTQSLPENRLLRLKGIRAPFDLEIMAVERINDDKHVRRFVVRRLGRNALPAQPFEKKNADEIKIATRYVGSIVSNKIARDKVKHELALQRIEEQRLIAEQERQAKIFNGVFWGIVVGGLALMLGA